MELLIYRNTYDSADAITDFQDIYNYIHLTHLASDLLEKGLTPHQVTDAVLKAIKIGKASGMEIQKHFRPVFTDMNRKIINDCKLSKLAYGLVLLNANPELSSVGEWQIKVLENFFN